jgi:hypothetical protein
MNNEQGRPPTRIELVALALTLLAILVFVFEVTSQVHPHH